MKKLQTLWGHWWKLHGDSADDSRTARLRYLSSSFKRPVTSAKELSRDEAEQAIKGLAASLPEHLSTKKRLSRRDAREIAVAGRKDKKGVSNSEQIVGPTELRHIRNLMDQLGWDNARLQGFLHSPFSPLGGRSVIRTVDDAFKVRYALKGILSKMSEVAIR